MTKLGGQPDLKALAGRTLWWVAPDPRNSYLILALGWRRWVIIGQGSRGPQLRRDDLTLDLSGQYGDWFLLP